jgi:Zn-dependent peptidase ImmA (M78 family)
MKTQRQTVIRQKANRLLRENGVLEAPVDVEAIAASLHIEIRKSPTDDEISGFLLKHPDGTAVIGVNVLHHPNRQRFTVGHEIGHFVLHQFEQVHVDKFVLKLRSDASSTGENEEEVEANRFAAELLMPWEFLADDLPKYSVRDLLDDRGMQQLSKRYKVSVQAMTNRLVSLGFINGEALS